MTDSLSALRLFVRVARSGSFAEAAREGDIAPATASRTVAALEKELGVALLTRTTRLLTLTEAGARYLQRVTALLAALEEADEEARGTGELRGTLQVGLSSALASRVVIPVLARFAQQHAGLRVELLVEDGDRFPDRADLMLRLGEPRDAAGVTRRLLTTPRVVAAARAWLARAGTPRTPEELSTHATVNAAGEDWTFSREGHDDVTLRLAGPLTADRDDAAVAAAVAGLGVVVTTRLGCRAELESGALVELLTEWDSGRVGLHAQFAGGRPPTLAAKAFTEFLVEALDAPRGGVRTA